MGKAISALMHANQIDEFVDGLNGGANKVIITFVAVFLHQRFLQLTSSSVYLCQGDVNELRVFIVLSGEEKRYQVDLLDKVNLFYVLDQCLNNVTHNFFG